MDLRINILESSDDEFDADDERQIRRPYTMKRKPDNYEIWDDQDFFSRFRLKKDTVTELLHSIEDHLLILWNKYDFVLIIQLIFIYIII